jgi:hypothetical protein
LKNQWGWGGFVTHDLARCRLAASWRRSRASVSSKRHERGGIAQRHVEQGRLIRETQEMAFDAHGRAFSFFKGACTRGIVKMSRY